MFGKILRELRKENNLNQSELAKKIGLSASAVGMYEQGRRQPGLELINKIADLFNVSSDFLIGRSNIRKSDDSKNIAKTNENSPYLVQAYDKNLPPEELRKIEKYINHIYKRYEKKGLKRV